MRWLDANTNCSLNSNAKCSSLTWHVSLTSSTASMSVPAFKRRCTTSFYPSCDMQEDRTEKLSGEVFGKKKRQQSRQDILSKLLRMKNQKIETMRRCCYSVYSLLLPLVWTYEIEMELTQSFALVSAPISTKYFTVSPWPWREAKASVVSPFWIMEKIILIQ